MSDPVEKSQPAGKSQPKEPVGNPGSRSLLCCKSYQCTIL
eukprot:01035.XXX_2966_3085_1 [CDS] Oithona nana genome sequencing.